MTTSATIEAGTDTIAIAYEPVNTLLAEVRERRKIANAVVTWMNSYKLFRKIEKRIGLPSMDDTDQRDAYLAIVRNLRASGEKLLHLAKTSGIDMKSDAEISEGNFGACLEMLDMDEGAVLLTKDDIASMERHFGIA